MNFLDDKIKTVSVTARQLTVKLEDGRAVSLPLTRFPTLAKATAAERKRWEVCGAGTGIHWPLLDYDLSVAGLLRGEGEAPGISRRSKSTKYPTSKEVELAALREEAAKDEAGSPLAAKVGSGTATGAHGVTRPTTKLKPSALLDTRVIHCGDNLEQLKKLPDACVDLIYIDPPFNSNRNYELFWGQTKKKRAFEDRHAAHYVKVMLDLVCRIKLN